MPLSKNTLKDRINAAIRNKSLPDTITPGDVSDRLAELCDNCIMEQVDVFLIAGQSNARGMSGPTGAANSPNPEPGTLFQFGNGSFLEVTDEVGDANTGSIWPSFAITWKEMTARKICFVPRARNATALSILANTGEGYWGEGAASFFPDSVTNINGALAALVEQGYDPKFRGVLWSQGENDAYAINRGVMTKQNYKDELAILLSKYRAIYGSNMPFYIIKTGTRTGSAGPLTDVTGYQQIQEAQEEACDADPLRTKIIYRSTTEFHDRGLMMSDGVHYGQLANNEIGRTAPSVILAGADPV
jgi:hypothetical protein